MPFMHPVADVIRLRRSCRHYSSQPLSAVHQNQLSIFLEKQFAPPFGARPRFVLVQADERDGDSLRGLGTYGFIKGARAFLVGLLPLASDDSTMDHEDFAFALEEIVLFATDRGWGTCWLGASFTRSRFAEKASAGENEWIPAITPIGYAAEHPSNRERLLRWSIQAHRRKEWSELFYFGGSHTHLTPELAGEYADALDMVRLGPSGSNMQPWRVVKELDRKIFHFYIQRNKVYQSNRLIRADIQRLDIGIAMCHFQWMARVKGLQGGWMSQVPSGTDTPSHWEYRVSWVDENVPTAR